MKKEWKISELLFEAVNAAYAKRMGKKNAYICSTRKKDSVDPSPFWSNPSPLDYFNRDALIQGDIRNSKLWLYMQREGKSPAKITVQIRSIIAELLELRNKKGFELLEKACRYAVDVQIGRRRKDQNQTRTNKSTETKKDKKNPVMEATWNEAKDILKTNKKLSGHLHSIASKIEERFKENRIKEKLLISQKLSHDTYVRYLKASTKPL